MKYTIYLVLAGMACGCKPVLTLETNVSHPFIKDSAVAHPPISDGSLFHPPMADGFGYILLPSTDRTVITAEPIGNVSYQQTVSSTPWSYDEIAGWINGDGAGERGQSR